MKLIGLLVLLGLVSLVEGEVVKSFAVSCPEFFVKDQNNRAVPPTVLTDQNNKDRYKQICQKYKNVYRYATLYDTGNRIPVYSAYRYKGYENVERRRGWMIEPQLDLDRKSKDWKSMAEMTLISKTHNGRWGEHQALDTDYSKHNGQYQRGHLYPHCHNCHQDLAYSTFTLTNVAPQDEEDNKDWYGQVEKVTANNNWCQPDTAHVVTGVVPGHEWMTEGKTNNTQTSTRKRNCEEDRVNVPDYFWSAVRCRCRVNNTNYLSEGFLAATKTGMERSQGRHPGKGWKMVARQMSVEKLNNALSKLYTTNDFKVFGDMLKEERLKNKSKGTINRSS